jgi:hypothetical protein
MRGWRVGWSKEDDGSRLILALEDMGRIVFAAQGRNEGGPAPITKGISHIIKAHLE